MVREEVKTVNNQEYENKENDAGRYTFGRLLYSGSSTGIPQDQPFKINETYFPESVYSIATLHVPGGSEEAFGKDDGWMKFGKIQVDVTLGIAKIKYGCNGSEALPYRLDGVRMLSRKGLIIQNGRKRIVGVNIK